MQYVYEVEVEVHNDVEYCGCEYSVDRKRYGLYASLDEGIRAVEDKDGPVIKEVLRGEDWMLSGYSLYADQEGSGNIGASFTVYDTSVPGGGELMYVVLVTRVEVKRVYR